MQLHCQIFCASIAISLTTSIVSAVAETNCIDNSSYRSPKLGLACAQHKDLDCREFGVVEYSNDDINDLLRQCPSSCAVEGCAAATETIDDHQHQQGNDVQTSVKRSRSLRGLLPINTVSTCPAEWDETCRDDPNFISKLQLPCSQHVTFDCSVLGAIGFGLQDIVDLISSCPCSCDVECGAPTSSPSTSPSPAPTATASASPSVSPTTTPTASPTTPSPTLHPTNAPTTVTSSPTKIATESPSLSPSVEGEGIHSVIAEVITSEESSQNQNDDSALGFLPFSSSIFYGIIAAAACVGLVAIAVVTRRVKASRRHDDDDMSSSKMSGTSQTTSGSSKVTVKRKTTSLKKTRSISDGRSQSNTSRGSMSTSRASTSRAGSKSGFKAECLQTRSYNTGTRASASTAWRPGSTMSGSALEENDSMSYTESMYTRSTKNEPADIEQGVKQNLQDKLGPAPSNGPGRSIYDWSIADVHGVSGLSDWWNSKSENKAAGNDNKKSGESGGAWWDFVGASQVETSLNGDDKSKGTSNVSKSASGEQKQRRGRLSTKHKSVKSRKKTSKGSVESASKDEEVEQSTLGGMITNVINTFSGDEADEQQERQSDSRPRRSKSRSKSGSRSTRITDGRKREREVKPAEDSESWFSSGTQSTMCI